MSRSTLIMRALYVAGIILLTAFCSNAANAPNLAVLVAKAAAAVKRVIPSSEAEVQGSTAVVKKRTSLVPRQDTIGRMEIPDRYGIMFIIRLQAGPYKGLPLPTTPRFNHRSDSQLAKELDIQEMVRHNRQQDAYLRGLDCFRTAAVRELAKSNLVIVVEIIFGSYTDTRTLEQAYAELIRSLDSELR